MCTHACNMCNISLYKGNTRQSRIKSIVYMTCSWQSAEKQIRNFHVHFNDQEILSNLNSDSWGLGCTGDSTFSKILRKTCTSDLLPCIEYQGSVSVIHKVKPTKPTSLASPGNLLEMHIPRPNSRLLNQKLQGLFKNMVLNSKDPLLLGFLFNSNRS